MAFNIDFPDSDIPEGITRKQIVNYARLRGSKRSLDMEHGEDEWGLPEILVRLQAKAEVVQEVRTHRATDEQKRYEAYTSSFENITPNDEHSFRTLVAIEMRMESIQQSLKSGEEVKLKELTDSLKTLSTEHRQIQISLGIDRAKRGDQINIASELEVFKGAASELITKAGVTITCTHCQSRFNFGFIVFHFRDDVPWTFSFNCPKCSQLSALSGIKEYSDVPFDIPTPNMESPVLHGAMFSVLDGGMDTVDE